MKLPEVVSREEWLSARKELLSPEKQLTRARDALDADRRRLPIVEIDNDYVFEGATGSERLADLFEGRRQLIVYHFEPAGRSEGPFMSWIRRHDEYPEQQRAAR